MAHFYVVVHQGINMTDTDVIGKMDPYVKVEFKSQKFRTAVKEKAGSYCEWNEVFKISAKDSDPVNDVIRFTVLDKDTFVDDTVGTVSQKGFGNFGRSSLTLQHDSMHNRGVLEVSVYLPTFEISLQKLGGYLSPEWQSRLFKICYSPPQLKWFNEGDEAGKFEINKQISIVEDHSEGVPIVHIRPSNYHKDKTYKLKFNNKDEMNSFLDYFRFVQNYGKN